MISFDLMVEQGMSVMGSFLIALRTCAFVRPISFMDSSVYRSMAFASGASVALCSAITHALALKTTRYKSKTFLHDTYLSPRHQHLRPNDQKFYPCARYKMDCPP